MPLEDEIDRRIEDVINAAFSETAPNNQTSEESPRISDPEFAQSLGRLFNGISEEVERAIPNMANALFSDGSNNTTLTTSSFAISDGEITGIDILPGHGETPGLGARVDEDSFKEQFRGRSLNNSVWKVKKDGGNIDQISGATISPRGVAEAVKKGLEIYSKK